MRSQFLVHWTDKNFCVDRDKLTPQDREKYVQRLGEILTDGLWMTMPPKPPSEMLKGGGGRVHYSIPMTCFTEIKLSQTQPHCKRYGLLGVGVDRQFVLDRLGGPVHYVRNHSDECILEWYAAIGTLLKNGTMDGVQITDTHQFMEEVYYPFASFMKAMSNEGKDDYEYLEEHEWRIVATKRLEATGKIKPAPLGRRRHLIPLQPADLKIIIFPDNETREIAVSKFDKLIRATPTGLPMLLTQKDCEHF